MTIRLDLLGMANAKTIKGEKRGWLTAVLYLAPDSSAFGSEHDPERTLCPFSTRGCRAACLNTAGRGQLSFVQQSRIGKSRAFATDPARFVDLLRADARRLVDCARRDGMRAAVRLNGTSDVPWERYDVFVPDAAYYDYTKWPLEERDGPPSYRLVYSVSESRASWRRAERYLDAGHTAAVVFSSKEHIAEIVSVGYRGYPAVNGDADDLRFLDPPGHVVALSAKGRGRTDATGFVRRPAIPVV